MVLIVEDDLVSRRALLQLLRMHGHGAEAVGSAEEAMELIARGPVPDIVLLDIDLPGMSGLELARSLRRTNPRMVPFFVTASEERYEELSLARLGRFFRKPVDIARLLEMIDCLQVA